MNKLILIIFLILLLTIVNIKKNNVEKFVDYNDFIKNINNEFNLFFQYPAITEKICYQQNKNNKFYIGLPWATIIDKNLDNKIYQYIKKKKKEKNIEFDNIYFSSCQHISFKRILKIAKLLGIKTMYISHKIKDEDKLNEITLKPIPIYAVNIEDENRNNIFKNVDFLHNQRKYLLSFMGAVYLKVYLTDIRKNIFEFQDNFEGNNFFKNTGKWHFQDDVYKKQTKGIDLSQKKKEKNKNNTELYNEVLLNSRFSLCPSGSGPNTIRFWESLAIGSIPILLSDTLELPPHKLWKDAIIIIKEQDYKNISNIIKNIDEIKEMRMKKNCLIIYNDFKNNFLSNT